MSDVSSNQSIHEKQSKVRKQVKQSKATEIADEMKIKSKSKNEMTIQSTESESNQDNEDIRNKKKPKKQIDEGRSQGNLIGSKELSGDARSQHKDEKHRDGVINQDINKKQSKYIHEQSSVHLSTEPPITPFRGEDHELSNLYALSIPITYKGSNYYSVEHAYKTEKAKCYDREDLKLVIEEMKNAKHMMLEINQQLKESETEENKAKWKNKKVRVMKELLFEKFKSCDEFRNTVLQSKNGQFVEVTSHLFWGSGLSLRDTLSTDRKDWPGLNVMGDLLEDLYNSHTQNNLQCNKSTQVDLIHASVPTKINTSQTNADPNPKDLQIKTLSCRVASLESKIIELEKHVQELERNISHQKMPKDNMICYYFDK